MDTHRRERIASADFCQNTIKLAELRGRYFLKIGKIYIDYLAKVCYNNTNYLYTSEWAFCPFVKRRLLWIRNI